MGRTVLVVGWLLVLGMSAILPLSALFHGIVHVGPDPLVGRRVQMAPIIALGSDVFLRHGSRGVVVAVLGNVDVRGTAHDDVVVLGGRAYLERGSRVQGD